MGYSMREWALKWIEGSLISLIKGNTPLNIVIGRIKRSIESYGVKPRDVMSLISSIESNPVYLPSLSSEEKTTKLKPVKDVIETMMGGCNV
jgi:hypothetical protein